MDPSTSLTESNLKEGCRQTSYSAHVCTRESERLQQVFGMVWLFTVMCALVHAYIIKVCGNAVDMYVVHNSQMLVVNHQPTLYAFKTTPMVT